MNGHRSGCFAVFGCELQFILSEGFAYPGAVRLHRDTSGVEGVTEGHRLLGERFTVLLNLGVEFVLDVSAGVSYRSFSYGQINLRSISDSKMVKG